MSTSLDSAQNFHARDNSQNFDHSDSVAAKCLREVELVGHGIVVGGFMDGVTQIGDHPLEFVGGLAGAAGIALAMKGPAWMRVPAMGLAVLGNVGFGLHAVDCVRTAAPALENAWESGRDMEKNRAIADRSIGSLAFDMAVMGVVGKGTAKLAGKIPESPGLLRRSFQTRADGLAESMANSIGIGRGQEFAYAGSGGGRFGSFEVTMPETRLASGSSEVLGDASKPMMMAASGTGSGGKSNPWNYKDRWEGPNKIIEMDNVKMPGQGANTVNHADKTRTALGYNGSVQVNFPDGQSRYISLGRAIAQIKIRELPDGTKEFHFNGSTTPDMVTRPDVHLVSARTANGIEHTFDRSSVPFEHSMGGKTSIDSKGNVNVLFPDLQSRTLSVAKPISKIHLIEGSSGINEYRFNDSTRPELITNPKAHLMSAILPSGMKVHLFDLPSIPFATEDGLQTTFSKNGTISFRLPDGTTKTEHINGTIDQIMAAENKNGAKSFITYAARGNVATENAALTVPPLSMHSYWYAAPAMAGAAGARSRMARFASGFFGATGTGGSATGSGVPVPDRYPPWRLGIPHSVHRAILDPIAGIDSRALPDNDLRRMSDLGIVMQKHNWLVEDYLARMDSPKK